jgi:hypothetical protein
MPYSSIGRQVVDKGIFTCKPLPQHPPEAVWAKPVIISI